MTTSSVLKRYLGTSLRSKGRSLGTAGTAGSTRLMLASRYSCASLATSCQDFPVMVVVERNHCETMGRLFVQSIGKQPSWTSGCLEKPSDFGSCSTYSVIIAEVQDPTACGGASSKRLPRIIICDLIRRVRALLITAIWKNPNLAGTPTPFSMPLERNLCDLSSNRPSHVRR